MCSSLEMVAVSEYGIDFAVCYGVAAMVAARAGLCGHAGSGDFCMASGATAMVGPGGGCGENACRDGIGSGYEGTDEYVPINADAYEVDPTMRKATLDGPGRAQIRVQEWGAQEKEFTAQVSEPTTLVIRLFNYPAWQVEVNGRLVSTQTRETTGVMVVPVGAGDNNVRIKFIRTWDRMVGAAISGFTLLLLMAATIIRNLKKFR